MSTLMDSLTQICIKDDMSFLRSFEDYHTLGSCEHSADRMTATVTAYEVQQMEDTGATWVVITVTPCPVKNSTLTHTKAYIVEEASQLIEVYETLCKMMLWKGKRHMESAMNYAPA